MKIVFNIVRLPQTSADAINYSALIFNVELVKRIDIDNINDLKVFFKTMVGGGARKILLNMMALEYIDSSGIGGLIDVAKLMRSKDGDLAFYNVSAEIKNTFKIIKFQDFIKVFNSEGEAINFFSYI